MSTGYNYEPKVISWRKWNVTDEKVKISGKPSCERRSHDKNDKNMLILIL